MDGQNVRERTGCAMKEDTQYCPIKRWVPLLLLSVLYVANNAVVNDDGDNGRKVSDGTRTLLLRD